MSLGAGSSHERANSNSESNSYGYTGSDSSESSSQTIFNSEAFAQLFGNAGGAATRAAAGAPEIMQAARSLFTGGSNMLSSLGGDAGTQYLEDSLTSGDSPELQGQLGLLRDDTSRLFNEDLLPSITSQSVAGGTLGGGRQGVAEGQALDAVGRSYATGAANLRSADLQRKTGAAQSVAQNSLASSATGLGALPQLLSLLDEGNGAEQGIFERLSQTLGGPQTLTSSAGRSRAYGENASAANSHSRSSGSSWNFSAAIGDS